MIQRPDRRAPGPASASRPADPAPALQTVRLRLRGLLESDRDAVFSLYSCPDATRYLGRTPMRDVAAAQAFIEQTHAFGREGRGIRWALQLRSCSTMIGMCALTGLNDPDEPGPLLSYALAKPFRGLGLMTEALEAVLAHADDELNAAGVEAWIHPHNRASIRLVERLGFVRAEAFRAGRADDASDRRFVRVRPASAPHPN